MENTFGPMLVARISRFVGQHNVILFAYNCGRRFSPNALSNKHAQTHAEQASRWPATGTRMIFSTLPQLQMTTILMLPHQRHGRIARHHISQVSQSRSSLTPTQRRRMVLAEWRVRILHAQLKIMVAAIGPNLLMTISSDHPMLASVFEHAANRLNVHGPR